MPGDDLCSEKVYSVFKNTFLLAEQKGWRRLDYFGVLRLGRYDVGCPDPQ
jgi:hypothetical protein